MRFYSVLAMVSLLVLPAFPPASQASPVSRKQAGWGPLSPWAAAWNPKAIARVKGKILSVDRLIPGPKMQPGVGLTLASGSRKLTVHLGPRWYLAELNADFTPGEAVVVTGSKGRWQGQPVLFASSVRAGRQGYRLRAISGVPFWSGGLGGWGPDSPWCRTWDASSIASFTGTIARLEKLVPVAGAMEGILILVETETAPEKIHIGPRWYLSEQKIKLMAGQTVSVTGARLEWQGQPVVMASELRLPGRTLKLRDQKGAPAWSGGR
ncbi:MAG: hypothetical protein IT210_11560 [Armatimonadetes bacterium]|nr:hypothetical protein [Armatimonadota bacterium]